MKLLTLIFGAAAFENSVLMWASEHRNHHKHVDHEDDPYAISKGFFFAHIGWLLFKLNSDEPYDNVSDLQKDKLVVWQDKYVQWIAVCSGFILPALLGWLYQGGWVGALGGFLFGGVARVVAVQHCTFFINSACHTFGTQPYSERCSARDSTFMAFFTFGEGYHNYHHEFQHDYRNGVKNWQWDPTKWAIWLMQKCGLANNLRRVPSEKIILAQIIEAQRQLEAKTGGEFDHSAAKHAHAAAGVPGLSSGTQRALGRATPRVRENDRANAGEFAREDDRVAGRFEDGVGASEIRADDRSGAVARGGWRRSYDRSNLLIGAICLPPAGKSLLGWQNRCQGVRFCRPRGTCGKETGIPTAKAVGYCRNRTTDLPGQI